MSTVIAPEFGRSLQRSVGLIVAGPAAFGLAFGLQRGVTEGLRAAWSTPVVMIGVAALLAPALYIGAAWLGAAPEGRRFVGEWARAIGSVSRLLLALAPATGFLVASSQGTATGLVLGGMGIALATGLVLWRMHSALFSDGHLAVHVLYVIWAGVGLGIGARLFLEVIAGIAL